MECREHTSERSFQDFMGVVILKVVLLSVYSMLA